MTNSDTDSVKSKSNKVLRKADVLGIETRNVSRHWLSPVSLVSRQDAAKNPQQHLSPTYGKGQNTPEELSALRTTRMIKSLGRTAIFSSSPYVDTAFEALVTHGDATIAGPRRTNGRIPRPGAKAAAVRRAKLLVSQSAPFKPEVPFADAMRVCTMYNDPTAIPAVLQTYVFSKPRLPGTKLEHYADVLAVQLPALQLQAAAMLLQQGYYFAAIKAVYGDMELLKATLDEMRLIVGQDLDAEQWEAAARGWRWQESDKDMFLRQFKSLKIIGFYLDVRVQLKAMKQQGMIALARVEREMLLKVVDDFQRQLTEDMQTVLAQQQAAQQAADLAYQPAGTTAAASAAAPTAGPAPALAAPSDGPASNAQALQDASDEAAMATLPTPVQVSYGSLGVYAGMAPAPAPVLSPVAEEGDAEVLSAQPSEQEPNSSVVDGGQAAADVELQAEATAADLVQQEQGQQQHPLEEPSALSVELPTAAEVPQEPASSSKPPSRPASSSTQQQQAPAKPASRPASSSAQQQQAPAKPASRPASSSAQQQPVPASTPRVPSRPASSSAQKQQSPAAAIPAQEPEQAPALQQEEEQQPGQPEQQPEPTVQQPEQPQQPADSSEQPVEAEQLIELPLQPAEPEQVAGLPQPSVELEQPAVAQQQAAEGQQPEQPAEEQQQGEVDVRDQEAAPADAAAGDGPQAPGASAEASDAGATPSAEAASPSEPASGQADEEAAAFASGTQLQQPASASGSRQPSRSPSTAGSQVQAQPKAGTPPGSKPASRAGSATGSQPKAASHSQSPAAAPASPARSAPTSRVGSAASQQRGQSPAASPRPAASPSPLPDGSLIEPASPARSMPSSRVPSRQVSSAGHEAAAAPRPPLSRMASSQRSRQPGAPSPRPDAVARMSPQLPGSRTGSATGMPRPDFLGDAPLASPARSSMSRGSFNASPSPRAHTPESGPVGSFGSMPETPRSRLSSSLGDGADVSAALKQLLQEAPASPGPVPGGEDPAAQLDAEKRAEEMEEQRNQAMQDMIDARGRILEDALVVSQLNLQQLAEQREQLRSSQSDRRAPSTPDTDRKLADVEHQLRAEAERAEQLRVEQQRLEDDRLKFEEEKRRAEAERRELNDQVAKTMKMFQEQLATTVKMAAMLQAHRIMAGGSSGGAPGGAGSSGGAAPAPTVPEVQLPQEVDEPPTEEEISEYARYLGMDPVADADLLYIAEWALTAPVPDGWTVHLDSAGHEFFHNAATNQSTYEHPMDEHYRQYYVKMKGDKAAKQQGARSLRV